MENQSNYPEGIVKFGDTPLNLTKMSEDLGVSAAQLSFVFSGKRNPSIKLAKKLAAYFRISTDTLFSLLETRSTTPVNPE